MNIHPKSEFTYWFQKITETTVSVHVRLDTEDATIAFSKDPIAYLTYAIEGDGNIVCQNIELRSDDADDICKEIRIDFDLFCKYRPELALWSPIVASTAYASDASLDMLKDAYDILIYACVLTMYSETKMSDERACKRAQQICDWLATTDFYTAPGSTQYHDSYPTGLVNHSLRVAHEVIQLQNHVKFCNVNTAEAVICALMHDWCKINKYESYTRNVKNEATGQWEKVPAYRYKDAAVPLGHGETSMYLASRFISLTPEMACALRWHMGAWQINSSICNELQQANETYPMVLLLQFADQLSITKY